MAVLDLEDRDPAGAAHRKFGLPERSGAGKGAPLFGAAKRTLAVEHRSGRKDSAMGGGRGDHDRDLVGGLGAIPTTRVRQSGKNRIPKGKKP